MNNETKISYAKLHAPIFVPGVGNLKETLVDDITGPSRGILMTLTGELLRVNLKDVEILIPMTSVTHMVVEKQK